MWGGGGNAEREDTGMTSRLEAIVGPHNKKKEKKRKTRRIKGFKGKIMNYL